MKRNMKTVLALMMLLLVSSLLTGCMEYIPSDEDRTMAVAKVLKDNQATPTDINYSLERYNLIRRAYWVNGQREKANALVCQVEKPLGYIVLFTGSGSIVNTFVVDGKVTSLNSYLTPDSEYYSSGSYYNDWLADVDGSYGFNDDGIFFFTPDGKYIEWTGTYLYSDIPFIVDDPLVKIQVESDTSYSVDENSLVIETEEAETEEAETEETDVDISEVTEGEMAVASISRKKWYGSRMYR